MTEPQALKTQLERTLALAHAALEEPTAERVACAQELAADVFPRVRRLARRPLTLAEARQLMELVTQLRSVLVALAGPEGEQHPDR